MVSESVTRVLGLFAKRPVPGSVKTRLAAGSSPEWAAQVAEAFLLDLLDRLTPLSCRRVIAYAPRADRGYFETIAQGRFELAPQAEGDLGRRMKDLVSSRLRAGAERIVLLGTDSPTLPFFYIEDAFDRLKDHDLVLGPATDGGYYLIGLTNASLPIFDDIRWGTSVVLGQTLTRLNPTTRFALLPPWYDVDTLQDWEMLQGHLAAMIRSGANPGVPRTTALAGSSHD